MQSQRPEELSLFIGMAGCLSLVCSPAGRWHLAKVTARAWIRRTGRCFRTCPWTPGLLYLPFALVCLKGRRHGLPWPPWGAGQVRERHPHRSQPAPEPVPTLKTCAVPTASPRCCERRQTYPTASVYVYLSLMCIAVSFIPYAFCIVLYFYFVYFQRLFSDFGRVLTGHVEAAPGISRLYGWQQALGRELMLAACARRGRPVLHAARLRLLLALCRRLAGLHLCTWGDRDSKQQPGSSELADQYALLLGLWVIPPPSPRLFSSRSYPLSHIRLASVWFILKVILLHPGHFS